MNLHALAGNDAQNRFDPFGLDDFYTFPSEDTDPNSEGNKLRHFDGKFHPDKNSCAENLSTTAQHQQALLLRLRDAGDPKLIEFVFKNPSLDAGPWGFPGKTVMKKYRDHLDRLKFHGGRARKCFNIVIDQNRSGKCGSCLGLPRTIPETKTTLDKLMDHLTDLINTMDQVPVLVPVPVPVPQPTVPGFWETWGPTVGWGAVTVGAASLPFDGPAGDVACGAKFIQSLTRAFATP